MGNTLPVEQRSVPDRAASLTIRPVISMERRFARTISVSKEIDLELPFHGLPLGCVHEAQSPGLANGIAFASLLSVRIPDPSGQKVYVAPDASFHSLGLLPYRVPPEQWIHVVARNSLDLAWTVLEALRCSKVSVVLAPVKSADLALCRRWQLAAEGSGATGFLLTDTAPKPSIASVVTRWQITSIPAPFGATFGEPHWAIDLVYCRGGRPAQWTAAWREERLEHRPPSRPLQRTALATANRLAV